jgi:hypothetical protein
MRRRTILMGLGALVATVAVLAGLRLYPSSSPDIGFASPDGDLACWVGAACNPGEVEVFKMSSLSNAHAGTVGASAYTYKVCCSGPAGLGPAPVGCRGTVLTLSADDNAHVASDGSYATEVTLWAPDWAVECTYGAACDPGYACLATISGSSNAHVADCDGVDDYATKVCCRDRPDVNSDAAIGNGVGIPGDDSTVANGDPADTEDDACETDGDTDNDGIPDGADSDPGGDITYDDNNDGIMLNAGDDGPSWDSNANSVIDGQEGNCPLAVNPSGDDDSDGLQNTWEVCKWGTNPGVIDSDSDGAGDCKEAADVDGNGIVDFVDDVIYYAKAALLPLASFGQDGDFDINGDGIVDFVDDVIHEAKFALIAGLCK